MKLLHYIRRDIELISGNGKSCSASHVDLLNLVDAFTFPLCILLLYFSFHWFRCIAKSIRDFQSIEIHGVTEEKVRKKTKAV